MSARGALPAQARVGRTPPAQHRSRQGDPHGHPHAAHSAASVHVHAAGVPARPGQRLERLGVEPTGGVFLSGRIAFRCSPRLVEGTGRSFFRVPLRLQCPGERRKRRAA